MFHISHVVYRLLLADNCVIYENELRTKLKYVIDPKSDSKVISNFIFQERLSDFKYIAGGLSILAFALFSLSSK